MVSAWYLRGDHELSRTKDIPLDPIAFSKLKGGGGKIDDDAVKRQDPGGLPIVNAAAPFAKERRDMEVIVKASPPGPWLLDHAAEPAYL
jgi:hypothetical protein